MRAAPTTMRSPVSDTAVRAPAGDGGVAAQERAEQAIARSSRRDGGILIALAVLLLIACVIAMGAGRLSVAPLDVIGIVLRELGITAVPETWSAKEETAVTLIRAPRALMAVIAGAALAVSGAVLQALFRNPLVSPDVIGVSSAASFGGVLAILLGGGGTALVTGSFVAGLAAVAVVMLIGRIRTGSPILTIVLGGIVVAAFFDALVSLVTYLADPYTTLPSITFWLMGSFASASWSKLAVLAVPVGIGLLVVLTLRWRINVLSLGDEEAQALGVRPRALRGLLIVSVALLTAATVASAGVIGWVGLVIPHLVRLVMGPDHRVLIPGSALLGGAYVLLMDTVARGLTEVEIPIGILTAVVGAPVFVAVLLQRAKGGRTLA